MYVCEGPVNRVEARIVHLEALVDGEWTGVEWSDVNEWCGKMLIGRAVDIDWKGWVLTGRAICVD